MIAKSAAIVMIFRKFLSASSESGCPALIGLERESSGGLMGLNGDKAFLSTSSVATTCGMRESSSVIRHSSLPAHTSMTFEHSTLRQVVLFSLRVMTSDYRSDPQ